MCDSVRLRLYVGRSSKKCAGVFPPLSMESMDRECAFGPISCCLYLCSLDPILFSAT